MAAPMCRKFAALLHSRCAYFDADIIHLRNPVEWLAPLDNSCFAVADTEWAKGRWTYTEETKKEYLSRSTLWVLDNFNAGFFAFQSLALGSRMIIESLSAPAHWKLLAGKFPNCGDQPGTNFLVNLTGIEIVNLCLPTARMESTMACDYREDFSNFLAKPNGPAFIHYAGAGRNLDAPIARLIFEHLSDAEAAEMRSAFEARSHASARQARWPFWVRVAKYIIPKLDERFTVRWNDGTP
jgi:hypothetical protein